jgi:hypothetical protein
MDGVKVKLIDIPKLSPNAFTHRNSFSSCLTPTCLRLDFETGLVHVGPEWQITGWSAKLPQHLMFGREGQIAVMLFCKEDGELWQHYPAYEETRDELVFETKHPLLVSKRKKAKS